MSLSPQQIALRLNCITATDVAAIVGCHPHRMPINVYLEKTGQAEPFEGNVRTYWGERLEPLIRRHYEERHHVHVELHGTHLHRDHDWWAATPDGLVFPRGAAMPTRGLEIKVHGRAEIISGNIEYGTPGTDEVPPHELVQCAWGMGATGLDRWDLLAFLDGMAEEYSIHRDDDLLEMLAEKAERFLVDHVRAKVPPPPDGSSAWDEWLKRRWKSNTADLLAVDTDPAIMQAIYQLRDMRADAADLEERTDKLVQELKVLIGDRGGFTWREPGRKKPSKLTWRRNKDGVRTDNKATVESIRTTAGLFITTNDHVLAMAADLIRRRDWNLLTDATFADVIAEAASTLSAIATFPTKTTPVPGARPFLAPRHWKKMKPSDDETTETPEEN